MVEHRRDFIASRKELSVAWEGHLPILAGSIQVLLEKVFCVGDPRVSVVLLLPLLEALFVHGLPTGAVEFNLVSIFRSRFPIQRMPHVHSRLIELSLDAFSVPSAVASAIEVLHSDLQACRII